MSHRSNSKRKPFTCEACSKTFRLHRFLKNHVTEQRKQGDDAHTALATKLGYADDNGNGSLSLSEQIAEIFLETYYQNKREGTLIKPLSEVLREGATRVTKKFRFVA